MDTLEDVVDDTLAAHVRVTKVLQNTGAAERCGVNLSRETTNTKHTHQRSEAL